MDFLGAMAKGTACKMCGCCGSKSTLRHSTVSSPRWGLLAVLYIFQPHSNQRLKNREEANERYTVFLLRAEENVFLNLPCPCWLSYAKHVASTQQWDGNA